MLIWSTGEDLNQQLNEFFAQHAIKEDVDRWFEKHPYQLAVSDEDKELWMAK